MGLDIYWSSDSGPIATPPSHWDSQTHAWDKILLWVVR